MQPTGELAVGDAVDGLCTVHNGSERWFPGIILAVNADKTYDIKFSDGEVQRHKDRAMIREKKRRERTPSRPESAQSSVNYASDFVPVVVTSSSQTAPTAEAVVQQPIAKGRPVGGTASSVSTSSVAVRGTLSGGVASGVSPPSSSSVMVVVDEMDVIGSDDALSAVDDNENEDEEDEAEEDGSGLVFEIPSVFGADRSAAQFNRK